MANQKQKAVKLKRIKAQNKLYKKTGYWSIKAMADANLRKHRNDEYLENANGWINYISLSSILR